MEKKEKIQNIDIPTINLPNYEYWVNQNTIDAQISLRNTGKYIFWNWVFNSTWLKTFNTWFLPKLIKFTAWIEWTNTWNCCWIMWNGYEYCTYNTFFWITTWIWSTNKLINIINWTTTNTSQISAYIIYNNSFIVNVESLSWWNVTYIYECFW